VEERGLRVATNPRVPAAEVDCARLRASDRERGSEPAARTCQSADLAGPNTIRRGPDPNAAKDCAFQRDLLGEAAFALRYGSFGNCVAQLARTKTLWFTETNANRVSQITTDGVIFEFQLPTAASQRLGIAQGPDGALWIAEFAANKIGRLEVQSVGAPASPGVRADTWQAEDPTELRE
jgi:streptogramin lyase